MSSKIEESDDEDAPTLSSSTLAALQEFLASKSIPELQPEEGEVNKEKLFSEELSMSFPEDWQLSQFWYDEETSKVLASIVLAESGSEGRVACLSCPSVFRACTGSSKVDLFEYDRRFEVFGSSYYFYDYNEPDRLPGSCLSNYSVIIADPPFLSEECLSKLAVSVKLLMKPDCKIILCTGDVLTQHAEKLLNLKKTEFIPRHKNNLGNEFACFANYQLLVTDHVHNNK